MISNKFGVGYSKSASYPSMRFYHPNDSTLDIMTVIRNMGDRFDGYKTAYGSKGYDAC